MSLFLFNKEKKQELVERVIQMSYQNHLQVNSDQRDELLEEMIYWEQKRADKIGTYKHRKKCLSYWDSFKERYLTADPALKNLLLKMSIEQYAHHIVGNFNPRVYDLSAKLIPPFLNLLLKPTSFAKILGLQSSLIDRTIVLTGNIRRIRALQEHATLVFTPTHLSNLDSILLGTAFYYAKLPPVMYGAGLNLFKNKIIGFFMNNLGAYKVDRLRIHQVYKEVLKEYATSAIEMGFHNLFFPGGTRSRSGAVEKKLKLGLMGATLKAYIRNLHNRKPNPNIYIIPMNVNAHLVLEAETLIDDFLAAMGKSRFIIENDEFSKPQRVLSYFKSHINLNSKTFVHFGDPLDPFGNAVNEDGMSVDKQGRSIDITRYIKKNGEIVCDEDRDRNYTKELGNSIIHSFHKNNRVMSTNLVAFTLYEMVTALHPSTDIYRLLRTYAYEQPIPIKVLCDKMERVIFQLKKLGLEGRIIYGDYLSPKNARQIVDEALTYFGTYHKRKTIYREGDNIYIGDLLLLYYYHNRLVGYNLEDLFRSEN